MKKLLAFLLVICMSIPTFASEVTTVTNADMLAQAQVGIEGIAQKPEQVYSTEVGLGRLVHTMQKTYQTEISIESILPYELDANMNVITLNSANPFINGRWLVYSVTTEEAPKNGYWYYLYDQYYHRLGIMAAQKIR